MLKKTSAQTLDVGHGRIEERYITVSDELSGYSDWPGLNQVFQLTRTVTFKKFQEDWGGAKGDYLWHHKPHHRRSRAKPIDVDNSESLAY